MGAAPIAAYCLRPIEALAQTVLVASLFGLALGTHGGDNLTLLRIWIATLGTVLVVTGLVVAIAISVRRQVRQMNHAATHDPLTGLANRTLMSLATAAALDRFKLLNDTHGHHAGDQWLAALSYRLRHCVPAEALVCRPGGDEFAILVDDPSGLLAPKSVAADITRAWDDPLCLDRGVVRTSGCLGVAVASSTNDTAQLLQHADAAMYRAKAEGRSGICVYDVAQQAGIERRLLLEQALFDAIGNGELSIVFQPIVDLNSGWVHADFTVHVNLSGKQLHDAFVEQIDRLLHFHGLEPTALMMALTESVLMRVGEAESDVLWALDELGVPLALDDFGTGFSSLSYLLQANVHTVKVDRSFVSGMSTDPTRQAIVETVIGLARALGRQVIAQGVEKLGHISQLVL